MEDKFSEKDLVTVKAHAKVVEPFYVNRFEGYVSDVIMDWYTTYYYILSAVEGTPDPTSGIWIEEKYIEFKEKNGI